MIKKLTNKDCDRAAEIFLECFSLPWSKSSVETELENENNILLGYFSDNILVGIIMAEKNDDNTYITNVAVDKKFRRRRIASKLIYALKDECRTDILLDVRVSNAAAIALYEGHGFSCIGVRKRMYSYPPEDAQVMEYHKKEKTEL